MAGTATIAAIDLHAQARMSPPTRWDLTAGSGDGVSTVSLGALRSRDVLPGKRIRIGLGLRATAVSGDQKMSPAGAKNVPAGVTDTLQAATAALMLNVAGHLSVVVSRRFEAGLNIDLAGLGAGPSRDATYRTSGGSAGTPVKASPATANLFQYGSKDRGSLNSEFFGAFQATERLTVRAGLSHQLTEYRAERDLTSNTDRFRRYANLCFVGARLSR